MQMKQVIVCALLSLAVSGCLVRTAADVVTAPVRVGAKAVDLATTSQSEADEKRGRELRKHEERLGKLEREYEKQLARCNEGNAEACNDARETHAEIEILLPTIPAEPDEK